MEHMTQDPCPCRRVNCPRHGDCAACREHHRACGRKPLTDCEKLEQKKKHKADRQRRKAREAAAGDEEREKRKEKREKEKLMDTAGRDRGCPAEKTEVWGESGTSQVLKRSTNTPSQENKEKHVASRILICAGALMSVSGILFAICEKAAYGGILFAAAACMFFAARGFRMAEDKSKKQGQGAEVAPEQAERRQE